MAIFTVCGSGKNKAVIHGLCTELESQGAFVLKPPLHDIEGLLDGVAEEGRMLAWKGATFAHLNRIITADVCIMANPGGYLGVGSTMELGYAVALGKVIIAMRDDAEEARQVLFDHILDTDDPTVAASMISELSAKF